MMRLFLSLSAYYLVYLTTCIGISFLVQWPISKKQIGFFSYKCTILKIYKLILSTSMFFSLLRSPNGSMCKMDKKIEGQLLAYITIITNTWPPWKLPEYSVSDYTTLVKNLSMIAYFVLLDRLLRECLCKSGPVDFAWDTDFARFSCVVRHSCTYTKTIISLIGSLYFSEFYGN